MVVLLLKSVHHSAVSQFARRINASYSCTSVHYLCYLCTALCTMLLDI